MRHSVFAGSLLLLGALGCGGESTGTDLLQELAKEVEPFAAEQVAALQGAGPPITLTPFAYYERVSPGPMMRTTDTRLLFAVHFQQGTREVVALAVAHRDSEDDERWFLGTSSHSGDSWLPFYYPPPENELNEFVWSWWFGNSKVYSRMTRDHEAWIRVFGFPAQF